MKKILIVDDDARIREAFEMLCGLDYEVLSVADGARALEQIKTAQPDLVILDWRLNSEVEGRDVLRHLKQSHPDIPVFVVTASVHFLEEIKTFEPTACFLKPCPDLKEKIDQFLNGSPNG